MGPKWGKERSLLVRMVRSRYLGAATLQLSPFSAQGGATMLLPPTSGQTGWGSLFLSLALMGGHSVSP